MKIRNAILITVFVLILIVILYTSIIIYNRIINIENIQNEYSNINALEAEKIANFENTTNEITSYEVILNENEAVQVRKEIDDWRLVLVNFDNELPNDFSPELVYIDKTRQIDSRIKNELEQMLRDMKKAKIGDIWVQSAYRSVEYQEKIYNEKIEEYISLGETREKAEILTLKFINKPGTSDHNLGLAVDFNYVDYNFDKTPAYEWLTQNAENYGFVLRYRKDKESITKIDYEPWHWRYVGVEHAKKMNELDMCLEEYVEYLSLN